MSTGQDINIIINMSFALDTECDCVFVLFFQEFNLRKRKAVLDMKDNVNKSRYFSALLTEETIWSTSKQNVSLLSIKMCRAEEKKKFISDGWLLRFNFVNVSRCSRWLIETWKALTWPRRDQNSSQSWVWSRAHCFINVCRWVLFIFSYKDVLMRSTCLYVTGPSECVIITGAFTGHTENQKYSPWHRTCRGRIIIQAAASDRILTSSEACTILYRYTPLITLYYMSV